MPLRKAGSAWIAGLLASAARRIRKPQGDQRAGSGDKSASMPLALSRSALSVLTRRSSGAREDSAAPSSARASPKCAGEMRIQPFRIIAGNMRRRSRQVGGVQPLALVIAQRFGRVLRAARQAWRSPRCRARARA